MLCIEGIARALRIFLEKEKAPDYKLVSPPDGPESYLTITVSPEVRLPDAYILVRDLRFI